MAVFSFSFSTVEAYFKHKPWWGRRTWCRVRNIETAAGRRKKPWHLVIEALTKTEGSHRKQPHSDTALIIWHSSSYPFVSACRLRQPHLHDVPDTFRGEPWMLANSSAMWSDLLSYLKQDIYTECADVCVSVNLELERLLLTRFQCSVLSSVTRLHFRCMNCKLLTNYMQTKTDLSDIKLHVNIIKVVYIHYFILDFL